MAGRIPWAVRAASRICKIAKSPVPRRSIASRAVPRRSFRLRRWSTKCATANGSIFRIKFKPTAIVLAMTIGRAIANPIGIGNGKNRLATSNIPAMRTPQRLNVARFWKTLSIRIRCWMADNLFWIICSG